MFAWVTKEADAQLLSLHHSEPVENRGTNLKNNCYSSHGDGEKECPSGRQSVSQSITQEDA